MFSFNLMVFFEDQYHGVVCLPQYFLRGFDLVYIVASICHGTMLSSFLDNVTHPDSRTKLKPRECPSGRTASQDEHAEVRTTLAMYTCPGWQVPSVNRSTLIQVRHSRGGDPVTVMPYQSNGANCWSSALLARTRSTRSTTRGALCSTRL